MQTILSFLTDLKANNNRDWFNDNKARYEEAREHFNSLINILIAKIKEFDPSIDIADAKDAVFRIYRDTRFSKNKEPYKTNMGGYIAGGGRKSNYAGYYLHIEPGESFAGGGIYCPQPPVLKSIREHIADDATQLREIINESEFKTVFPELYGDRVKTAPKGYSKEHPAIDLLRYKSYTVVQKFSDNELTASDFLDKIMHTFTTQQPFNDYLNEIISKQS